MPARDSELVMKVNPKDGRTWTAWTYRQGAETDIAISYRQSDGRWSEPTLFGTQDGIEQTQPTLVIDFNGNVYVAWAEADTGRVMLTARGFAVNYWSSPKVVNSSRLQGSAPALMVSAHRRLVVGFVADGRVRLVEFRLLPKTVATQMSDGPDPVGDGDTDEQTGDDDGTLNGDNNDERNDSFSDEDDPNTLDFASSRRESRRRQN